MKNVALLGVVLLIAAAAAGQSAELYSVGEKWVYEHEGAAPFRPPDANVEGDRIREVVGVRGEGEDKRWVIYEEWGENDQAGGRRLVTSQGMYDKIERDSANTTIDPPYPYSFMHLEPNEEMQAESTFQWGNNFTIPMKLTAKRLEDETVEVAAGKYEDCIHVEINESLSFTTQNGNEINIELSREQWYHPDVNGMVKEVYTSQGPNGNERKGTSELKSYTQGKQE